MLNPTWKPSFGKKAKPAEDPQTATSDRRRNWMWLLILLLLLLGGILTWRSCTSKNNADEPSAAPAQVYDNSFDRVIVARAYLDGVQTTVSKDCPRALVGFKFINNQPVKDFNFTGMTYEQAIQVVAEDWKPLVVDNLSADVKLSEQQMAVVLWLPCAWQKRISAFNLPPKGKRRRFRCCGKMAAASEEKRRNTQSRRRTDPVFLHAETALEQSAAN